MKRKIFLYLLGFSFLLIAGCSKENAEKPTAKERQDIILTKTQEGYLNKGNEFAINFFKAIFQEQKESFMISPLSLEYVLAMLSNNEGSGREQLMKTLGCEDMDLNALNEYYSFLINALNNADNTVSLNLANALIYNTMLFSPKENFSSAILNYYDAYIKGYDFSKEDVASLINAWVNKQTNGMIPRLLEGPVSVETAAMIMNAIYFKGAWSSSLDFDIRDTKKDTFYKNESETIRIPFMSIQTPISVYICELYESVRLPYGNSSFSMDILLPWDSVKFEDFIQSLNYEVLSNQYLGSCETRLMIPKFELENSFRLNTVMQKLGISDALFKQGVGQIEQKTKIKVDEKGTESAAVTYGFISSMNIDSQPRIYEFKANKPFVYVIREISTGAILFMGIFTGAQN